MEKVSFIVPCRNKAAFAANTVRTVLAQTYSPMEIVLSDQGSTDGTFDIITDLARSYNGPNTVRVLQCPDTEMKGMAGLNRHLNWLHQQIEGNVVVMCSADDLNHPDRVKHTMEAWEEHKPSYLGTCVQYMEADLQWKGEVTAYKQEDGWVDPVENVNGLIGSSASSCWARDLYEKYGPLNGVESQDILLPFFGTIERGLYYVAKPLHAYVRHASLENTGMEGVARAARSDAERAALNETTNYHYTSNWFAIMRRLIQNNMRISQELEEALVAKALDGANNWAVARDILTNNRIEPIGMKV